MWSGTKGDVTLKIGTWAAGNRIREHRPVGCGGGTTGAKPVNAGTYYVRGGHELRELRLGAGVYEEREPFGPG